MIRSVLALHCEPDRVAAILDLYRERNILQESLDLTRAHHSEISVDVDGRGEIIVTALWPDEAAYQEWVDHPRRGLGVPELAALVSDGEVGVARLYRIDHSVSKDERTPPNPHEG